MEFSPLDLLRLPELPCGPPARPLLRCHTDLYSIRTSGLGSGTLVARAWDADRDLQIATSHGAAWIIAESRGSVDLGREYEVRRGKELDLIREMKEAGIWT